MKKKICVLLTSIALLATVENKPFFEGIGNAVKDVGQGVGTAVKDVGHGVVHIFDPNADKSIPYKDIELSMPKCKKTVDAKLTYQYKHPKTDKVIHKSHSFKFTKKQKTAIVSIPKATDQLSIELTMGKAVHKQELNADEDKISLDCPKK